MSKTIMEKFYTFFSASFSGGYKVFSVLCITFFFSEPITRDFNKYYFVVLLCASLGMTPFASLMASKNFKINTYGKYFWNLFFSSLAFFVFYLFKDELDINLTTTLGLSIYFSVLLLGLYEVLRRELANSGDFYKIFLSGLATIFIFFVLIIISYYYNVQEGEFLLFFMAASFCVPMLFLVFAYDLNSSFFGGLSSSVFFKNYIYAFISNASSTSISFLLPLLLVYFLKDEVSSYLAVIFSASNLFMLIPRYMAEKNIVEMRKHGNYKSISKSTFKMTFLYFLLISLLSFTVFYFWGIENFVLYFLLFLSLQLTQLVLPYSNVLMVLGKFNLLLKANFIGLTPFLIIFIFYFLNLNSLQSCYLIIFLYILSNLMKLYFIKTYSFLTDKG